MALHELQHPYICGYKEFFVTWDREVRYMKKKIDVFQKLSISDIQNRLNPTHVAILRLCSGKV